MFIPGYACHTPVKLKHSTSDAQQCMCKVRKKSGKLGDEGLTDVELQRGDCERHKHPLPDEMF